MRKFDTINVIPFIDIMLVLLAIVLTTATFITNSQLEIAVPRASAEAPTADSESIEIAVDRDKRWYLDGTSLTINELRTRLQAQKTETKVLVRMAETVEFRQFVELIDLLKEFSLENVSIITRKNH